jgi:predicted DNA-binding transcriptional regulator AlpA
VTRLVLPAPAELEGVEAAALPALLAHLAALQAAVAARLAEMTPIHPTIAATEDKLLKIPDAAERIGMSEDYLYRHPDLPFMRRIGRRSLRVSSLALERWLANRGRGR